jgi:hypothetical protein
VLRRPGSNHGPEIGSQSNSSFQSQARLFSQNLRLSRQAFRPRTHWPCHVSCGLDQRVSAGFEDTIVYVPAPLDLACDRGTLVWGQFGDLKYSTSRKQVLRYFQVGMFGRTYPADAVERARHLVGHHRGTGQYGIDHVMTDQLGDQRGDALMDIGAASRHNRHAAPFLLGRGDPFGRRSQVRTARLR